jgi:hypothetical protein
MLSLLRTVFCDPGTAPTLTKDALKPVSSVLKDVYEKLLYIPNFGVGY